MNNDMNAFGINDIKLDLVVDQLEELKNVVSDLTVIKSKTLIEHSYDMLLVLINDIEQNVKTFKNDIDFVFEDKSIKKAVLEKHHQNLQKECTQLAMDLFGTTNYNSAGSDHTNDDKLNAEDHMTIINPEDFFGKSAISSICKNDSLDNKSSQNITNKTKSKSKNKTKIAAVSKKK